VIFLAVQFSNAERKDSESCKNILHQHTIKVPSAHKHDVAAETYRPFSLNRRKLITSTTIHYITLQPSRHGTTMLKPGATILETFLAQLSFFKQGLICKKKTSLGVGFFECQITAVPVIFPHLARPANEHCTFHHPGGAIDVRRGNEARGRLATRLGLLQPVSVVVVRVFTAVAD
jgi:hypothetical protein